MNRNQISSQRRPSQSHYFGKGVGGAHVEQPSLQRSCFNSAGNFGSVTSFFRNHLQPRIVCCFKESFWDETCSVIPRGSPVQRFRSLHQTTPLWSWFPCFTLTLSSAGYPGGYEPNFSKSFFCSDHVTPVGRFLLGGYTTQLSRGVYTYIYIISSYGNPYSPTRLSNGGFPSQFFETILLQLWELWTEQVLHVPDWCKQMFHKNTHWKQQKPDMEAKDGGFWHPFFKSLLFKISGNSGLLFFWVTSNLQHHIDLDTCIFPIWARVQNISLWM